ncbi:discoidin domain-containing protein [Streptosporangium sp. NPDC051022]|uniref:discoidin domain-containing protein n=1 Tax=Streptosporangium sp. NPDC051022 TaxID=3155752 RepID=UPI003412B9D2
MNNHWKAAALAAVISAATLAVTAQPAAAALGSTDFLKVSGSVLKKNSGTGATINLRGTNLGGWLTHEDWMSPLGEFALTRNGWTATASAGNASLAIDGDDTTRWTTGADQNGSEWLKVDMGVVSRFNRVTFGHTDFGGGDYARAFTVEVSTSGSTWTSVHSGAGNASSTVTTAGFTPVTARYVRVKQTGTGDKWWSVGEFNVFNDAASFDRAQWTASASGGTGSANLIDGDVSTRWTSGADQTPGMWVKLDLGARMTINNVTLDTQKDSTSEDDYPRAYTVQLSDNGSAWTQVASGTGTAKATNISFPAAGGRYVRVNQTGTDDKWWSVGEMSVGLNRDDYDLQLTLDQRFGATGAQTIRDAHENTWITTADFDNLAAMGVNFVRLPIGWTTLLNTDGTWRSSAWTKIDWAIDQLSSRGIYTLLDLHTVPGGGCPWASCGRVGPNPNGFWGSTTYQDWVVDIWQAIAARYAGNPAVAGYDLINEPLLDYTEDSADVAKKSAYYDRLYDAVRLVDPDHVIVMGAFFGFGAITPPSTYGWTNVVYELHPYDMPHATDWNAQNQLVTNHLNALPGLLSNPGVPVLYGEYSLYYYDDVWARWMAGLNAQQQSWSNWTYKTRGTDDDGQGYWGFHYNRTAPVPVINTDDSATFVQKLQRFATSTFTRNDRMVATVTRYAGGLSTFAPVSISRTGWTATASGTGGSGTLSGGIDGNSATKWNSGADQTPGQWYKIDMGTTRTVAMVTVQTPASSAATDYMRGYRLEFSTDGTTWTTVGSGIGFGGKRPISVTPQSTRYVKITQTGTADYWWSMDEVTMYSSY